jgi:MYXO-CTERM domain-containing protein
MIRAMAHAKLRFAVLCCCLAGSFAARAESAPAPRIFISNVTVTEGNSGQIPFSAQVSLLGYYYSSVTVRVTATPGTADESDYVFVPTEITLSNSGSPQTVTGYIIGDTNPEADEYFSLSAMPVVEAGSLGYLMNGYSTVTITDDDRPMASQLHVEGASVVEGNQGTTYAEVRVRLEPASTSTVTVAYKTVDGTATAGSDYQSASGTLTFAPGEVLKTVSIGILGDTVPEPDERLSVVLSQPTGALLGTSRGDVVIANDDGEPQGVDSGASSVPEPTGVDGGVVTPSPDTGVAADLAKASPDSGIAADLATPSPDTGVVADLASSTPNATTDAQVVAKDSGGSGDPKLAQQSGCSCAIGAEARSSGYVGLGFAGLLAMLVGVRRGRRQG